tara:strand:+ start:189 stop:467 length:279 start_codon:yes stop_codon:yes gene_type:complete
MGNRFEQWAALSVLDRSPKPGDLVTIFPIADMTGYVLCGAVYIGSHQVNFSDDGLGREGQPLLVHEVLYDGSVMSISGHSHEIQVIDVSTKC